MSIKEHPPRRRFSDGEPQHVPVLLEAALDILQPKPGESYLDLTAGYGGHAREFLARTKNYSDSILVDRDDFAIANLSEFSQKGVRILHSDFLAAANQLVEEHRQFDIVLVDLGVSSPQLDRSERGFSFQRSGPLDMRMDRRQELTAEIVVNTWTEADLIDIIRRYGEERPSQARMIAKAIVASRPLEDTSSLAESIAAVSKGRTKIHPATRTFQAIRIAINEELKQIEQMLPLLPELLAPGGRVGIISFHSLEDRLVKQYFSEQKAAGYEAELHIITKKPLSGDQYDVHNPRSRSAKLRVAVKP